MYYVYGVPVQLSRWTDTLRAGQSEIESRWERHFPQPPEPILGPTRVKRSGRGFKRPPYLATRLKIEYKYTSTPLCAFVTGCRANFTFNFTFTFTFSLYILYDLLYFGLAKTSHKLLSLACYVPSSAVLLGIVILIRPNILHGVTIQKTAV